MITFVNPQYLYLLLALPVVAILWLLARAARRKKLRRFGNPEVIAALMPEASRYTGWIKISLALLAMAAIIIAIARPIVPNKTGEATETASARGIELMICLDVSNSMLASSTDDPGGVSRLRRAKFILENSSTSFRTTRLASLYLLERATLSSPSLPITFRPRCLSTNSQPRWCLPRALQ